MAVGTFLPPSRYTLNNVFKLYNTRKKHQKIILSSIDQTVQDISAGKLTKSSTTQGNIQYYRSSINQIKLPVLKIGEQQLVVIKCRLFDPDPENPQPEHCIESGTYKNVYIVVLLSTDSTKQRRKPPIYCWARSMPHNQLQLDNAVNEIVINKKLPRSSESFVDHYGNCHFDGTNGKKRIGILMEYIPSTLLVKINDGSIANMSTEQIAELLRKLLTMLIALKTSNIRHGDIKLENTLVDPEIKDIKLCDFGCSLDITTPGGNRELSGSAQYVSPEDVYYNRVHYDTLSDMWAMGIIFFMICYNRHFIKNDHIKLLEKWGELNTVIDNAFAIFQPNDNAVPFIPLVKKMLTILPGLRPSPEACLRLHNTIVKKL